MLNLLEIANAIKNPDNLKLLNVIANIDAIKSVKGKISNWPCK